MSSLYFDDLHVGDELTGASRTITDAEVAMLPAMMGVTNPLFHDEQTARAGRFGARVLYGPALLGIAIGLTEPLFSGAALGLVALDAVRFLAPAKVGDTVTARLTVRELSPSVSGQSGRATVDDEVSNQAGTAVLGFRRTLALRARAG